MIKNAIKKETETQIYPLWLAHFIVAKITQQETISIEELMGNELTEKTKQSSPEEILNKFKKIVEIDKKKGGNNNG